ncbi:hypothetical protein [Streptomyces marispadix]|uniref:Uncharacterized protein n=1 Tax=Streptomyces marispadix TaxID=2922868 RepID=A0ABS9SSU0_9ACTN|nr:hypothetical protein [Streptomyces marispadix]MCH6159339.1 hypothetical protein [Streptomyces marispadix]
MPEPGSKAYDKKRARLRKDAEKEQHHASDQEADEEAKKRLEEEPRWRPSGPRTERGRGPKGER